MRRGLVRGEIESAAPQRLRISWPAAAYAVTYDPLTGLARINTSPSSWMHALNRLHHAAGIWHEWWVMQAWNLIVILVSISLILLGLSGVWMWWKRKQDRLAGAVMLLLSVGFSVTVLALCRAAI